jgi:hypothetical protein
MPDKTAPFYHIGDQYASALLPPIALELHALEARLDQYISRLHLSEGDRAQLTEARDAVIEARAQIDQLLSVR